MKRCLIAMLLLLLLCDDNALADSHAVEATNVQAGFTSWDTHASSGMVNNSYAINGGITFPVVSYLGASLSGAFGHTKLASNPSPNVTPTSAWPSCTISNSNLDAGLFVRDPTLGKVGVSYGAGRQQSHCSATYLITGTDTLSTKDSTASAEYYLSKVTLAVARTKTHLVPGSDLDSDSLTLGWYPDSDVRLALSVYGLDLKNSRQLGLEYQPEFLDDSLSLLLVYSSQRLTTDTHSIMVGFNYFFEKHVPLITRDRQYR